MKFRLSPDFIIDTDEKPWVNEGLRICIFGGAGSGKSWTAALIAEQFLSQGGTVVIFQPRAEYHTLKELKGDIIVLGGVYSKDLDFIPASPSTYARAIVERGISMIIYTTDVEDEEKLIDFTSKLIHYILKYQEEYKRPLLIILEEAQEYCPRSPSGHVAPAWVYSRMIKAFKDCFLQGRKLNVAMIAVSPRPQEINFSVRQLANLTFYGRFGAQDVSYIDKECLKWYRERGINVSARDLMDLDTGQFLVIGSEVKIIYVTEPRKTTHGAVTPQLRAEAPRKAETKVAISELAETIKKALEKEALEESELQKAKRRIAELERELEKSLERVRTLESQVEMLSKIRVETPAPQMDDSILNAISEIHGICERVLASYRTPATAEVKRAENDVYQMWEKKLPPSAAKILKLLVDTKGRKYTRREIAVAAGYSVNSGTFNHAISLLKRHGLIKMEKNHIWFE